METVTLAEDFARLESLVVSIPVAKILYSSALLVLCGLLLYIAAGLIREIHRVWLDKQTYLVDFGYDEGGLPQPAKGQALTNRFRSFLTNLEQIFTKRTDGSRLPEGAKIFQIEERILFGEAESPLADLQLNWQGIDFTGLVDKLRKWAWRPETMSAAISGSGIGTDALLKWTNAPAVPDDVPGGKASFFAVRGRPDGERAVFDLACRVFWLNAMHANAAFKEVDPDAFCEWGWLDLQYRTLEYRARRTAAGLSAKEVKQVQTLRDDAGRLIALDSDFALAFRLRADLIGLLPENKKTPQDRAAAVSDRETFARLTQSEPIVAATFAQSTTRLTLGAAAGAPMSLPAPADLDELQQSGSLAPGVPLVADGETLPFVTAGPIVVDAVGDRHLVLPGYATQVAERKSREAIGVGIRLMTGELVGYLSPPSAPGEPAEPITLVKLEEGLKSTNRIPVAGGAEFIVGEIAAPQVNDQVFLLHSGFFVSSLSQAASRSSARITAVRVRDASGLGDAQAAAFEAKPPITEPGQGGAPVINSEGKLVGLAHSGGPDADVFLEIDTILAERGLKLASP